jgi:NitT/TauT family transport system ATP-binding protein
MDVIEPAPEIQLLNVSKTFPTPKGDIVALENIGFSVQEGEFVVIVGASGCGKTTLLNLVAGFIEPTSGQILQKGNLIEGINPQCGMIFQQYALFPWKTVEENVEFGLKMKRIPKNERKETVRSYIELVGLTGFEKSYPISLSGGMKQRVSIARALANDPKVMLLDEPFAALDAMTRQVLQEQLVNIYEKQKKTIVFITHSIDEALMLSSRIIIMTARPGRIAQDIPNDLPHPRDASVQLSASYVELKRLIWDTVQAEVLKSMEIKP